MKLKLSLLVVFISLCSFSQKDIDVFKSEDYFIEYPKKWDLQKSERKDVEFILFSPKQKTDPFRENISLVIQELKAEMTMESYIELTESQLRNMMTGSSVIENLYDKINERHVLVYAVSVSGAQLKVKQHFYKKGKKMYILTFTALKKSYDDYKRVADSILNKFKFIPTP
ncbi:PsbP-related protein [Tenacibaculum sp. MEBiC06402]|uniref:PsbP-related protein n=1 Tax=unclassified Tenacibaculum TaxID=2635139 RepID=UPI003B990238